ncbi:putative beta-lysine N-acetyltransferase [Shewanella submarina]|uniref:Beta-lysine N-acetyltransferase n=1 Tax=Shewanella submarina TaxID=2016376 RepID=A0ABV7G9S7_9GAMM|nr:putative beta-lysine N-acetyltransferase [Shewanella submarina]
MKAARGEQLDVCTTLDGARIHYGPNSDRVYLMSMGKASPSAMPNLMQELADEHHLGKLIARVRQSDAEPFFEHGFVEEASLPGYFGSHGLGVDEDALFLAAYPDTDRRFDPKEAHNDKALKQAIAKLKPFRAANDWQVVPMTPAFANEMAHLYRGIFPDYPYPISDAGFLRNSMKEGVLYFGVRHQSRIIALASAELDPKNLAVEVADFATLPEYRGNHLAGLLLDHMEKRLVDEGFRLAFTTARAASIGINRTFACQGYQYQGRLINNALINGNIESMNVWSKALSTRY